MQTKPNKLQRLVEQFEALPRQKELKRAKFQLATIADQAEQHTKELKQALGRADILREVQSRPDLLRNEVAALLKALRSQAQVLESYVRSGDSQTQRVTSALDTLAKSTHKLSQEVSEAWTIADDEMLASTEALVSLVGTYDPDAQRRLQQALSGFKGASAPSGQEGVTEYRKAREALLSARLDLNIPGEVGAFLMDALRGTGSVRKLVDAEVRTFLDQHPQLWTRLSVRLV